ncbi:transglycosylase SLT domain-containing protein [bacterium]|nr:transglycosylase SLT domain-containing protein [bacterium]
MKLLSKIDRTGNQRTALFFVVFLVTCLAWPIATTATEQADFDPAFEFELLRQHYESAGSIDPIPLQLFIERCQNYNPELIKRHNLLLSLATLHYRNSAWSEALHLYQRITGLPATLEAGRLYRLGQCQAALGDHQHALLSFRAALKHNPISALQAKISFALADEYGQLGLFISQDKTLDSIMKKHRSRSVRNKVELRRGEAALQRKMLQTACQHFFTLINRSAIDAYSMKAMAHLRSFEEKRGWSSVYTDATRLRQAAWFSFRTGDFNHALTLYTYFQNTYSPSQYDTQVLKHIGDCLYRLGQYSQAIEYYQQLLDQTKNGAEMDPYRRKIASCYQAMAQYDQAIHLLKSVIERNARTENASYAFLSMAYCYELTDRYENALEAYRSLESTTHSDFLKEESRFRQAMILVRVDELEQALAEFDQMTTEDSFISRREDTLFWQTWLNSKLDHNGPARIALERLLAQFPNSVYLEQLSPELPDLINEVRTDLELTVIDQNRNPYDLLNKSSIKPGLCLELPDSSSTSQSYSNCPATGPTECALLFRFHYDYELCIDYYTDSLTTQWQDLALLVTVSHLHTVLGNHKQALSIAESIKKLFSDTIDWHKIRPHRRQLFFPLPLQNELIHASDNYALSPCLLAAIIHQESRFEHDVISSVGARGLMQIMPATGMQLARELALDGFALDKLLQTQTNISLGAYYFRQLLDHYQGSIAPALAAYNGGQHNVDLWLSLTPLPNENFNTINTIAAIRYRETRAYVKKILTNLQQYCQLYCLDDIVCPTDISQTTFDTN